MREIFDTAVRAVSPEALFEDCMPEPPAGKTLVIGAGKAAASMAHAFEKRWHEPVSGLVVTRYGHGVECKNIVVIESAHPVPDATGQEAAKKLLSLTKNLSAEDLVVCLMSGGASALLSLPAPGLTLQDKQDMNKALLRSGANINEMNCVRKHMSAIKGGRLTAACTPARVITYVISDIPGDDLTVVGSGPTLPDSTTSNDAIGILEKYAIKAPELVMDYLTSKISETPKPGDSIFNSNESILLAAAKDSLAAAKSCAEQTGLAVLNLGDDIQGEAQDVARDHAKIALNIAAGKETIKPPCIVLSGGETTVTVKGNGHGGRNVEYLLSLAIALNGHSEIYAIACDTDGIDGTEDNAGAFMTPETLQLGQKNNLDAQDYLNQNDAYSYFEKLDQLVITGPTLTNVNDFRAILIL